MVQERSVLSACADMRMNEDKNEKFPEGMIVGKRMEKRG